MLHGGGALLCQNVQRLTGLPYPPHQQAQAWSAVATGVRAEGEAKALGVSDFEAQKSGVQAAPEGGWDRGVCRDALRTDSTQGRRLYP